MENGYSRHHDAVENMDGDTQEHYITIETV